MGYLPFVASFGLGVVVMQATGNALAAQVAACFGLGGAAFVIGEIRLGSVAFEGTAARIAGVGLAILGVLRWWIDAEIAAASGP